MDAPQIGLPRIQWTRRGFVVTSLASGFALSVQPVTAQTMIGGFVPPPAYT